MFRRSAARLLAVPPLSAPAVTSALLTLPGWKMDGNSTRHIERDLLFVDFVAAMKFMQEVAPVCEKMGHHPMWLNVYNRVHVKLTTHDAGNAVSQKDVDLAKVMNETYAKYTKKK